MDRLEDGIQGLEHVAFVVKQQFAALQTAGIYAEIDRLGQAVSHKWNNESHPDSLFVQMAPVRMQAEMSRLEDELRVCERNIGQRLIDVVQTERERAAAVDQQRLAQIEASEQQHSALQRDVAAAQSARDQAMAEEQQLRRQLEKAQALDEQQSKVIKDLQRDLAAALSAAQCAMAQDLRERLGQRSSRQQLEYKAAHMIDCSSRHKYINMAVTESEERDTSDAAILDEFSKSSTERKQALLRTSQFRACIEASV